MNSTVRTSRRRRCCATPTVTRRSAAGRKGWRDTRAVVEALEESFAPNRGNGYLCGSEVVVLGIPILTRRVGTEVDLTSLKQRAKYHCHKATPVNGLSIRYMLPPDRSKTEIGGHSEIGALASRFCARFSWPPSPPFATAASAPPFGEELLDPSCPAVAGGG